MNIKLHALPSVIWSSTKYGRGPVSQIASLGAADRQESCYFKTYFRKSIFSNLFSFHSLDQAS